MAGAPKRPHLVVVRAGDDSLHERWLGSSRSWDLLVSYFGNDPDRFKSPEARRVDCSGGKWEGLYRLFLSEPELLEDYDYVWLPDDDIGADCSTIDKMFALMEDHGLCLAQPSLHPQSFFHHHVTVHNPCFRLRYSNFVELMVPCFKADFLRRLLPLFEHRRFGWGLDWIWAYMMDEPSLKTAVIDACVVTHTRPYREGSLYTAPEAHDPNEEANEFLDRLGLHQPPPSFVYAGLSRRGRLLNTRHFARLLRAGSRISARRISQPYGSEGFVEHLLEHCTRQTPELEPAPFAILHDNLRRKT